MSLYQPIYRSHCVFYTSNRTPSSSTWWNELSRGKYFSKRLLLRQITLVKCFEGFKTTVYMIKSVRLASTFSNDKKKTV